MSSILADRVVPLEAGVLTAGLLFSALCVGLAIAFLVERHVGRATRSLLSLSVLIYIAAGSGTAAVTGDPAAPVGFAVLALGITLGLGSKLRDFTPAGALLLITSFQLMILGLAWGLWFVAVIPVSPLTRGFMLAGWPLLLLTLPAGMIATFEQLEVLCRGVWRRPRSTLPRVDGDISPRVSIHVPSCSEPPAIVIETLDALARLDYPNYEVLVIDNNTRDAELWRPVQAHCQRLGGRFRFFHLAEWPGAKAGALNFALSRTAPDVDLIAVVDADYLVEPTFLSSLVGNFADSKVGFVQTPHDYRGFEGRRYLSMCYWEYRFFFTTTMISMNERDAALTVGTMCLLRREALLKAGGWAEWCVTEDSELAIRIHAAGYSSVYVAETFGRGLIPETFGGYKRQRFRWTYGPVQELKRHARLFVPPPLGLPSALTGPQRIHHANHGVDRLVIGLGMLLAPIGAAVAGSLLFHGETVRLPLAVWLAGGILALASVAQHWLLYRVAVGCSLRQTAGAWIAARALAHTVALASLTCLFTRTIPWRRTDKFKALPLGLGALRSAWAESVLGLCFAVVGSVGLIRVSSGAHLTLVLFASLVACGLGYLTAPFLALLAETDVRHATRVAGAASGASPLGTPFRHGSVVDAPATPTG